MSNTDVYENMPLTCGQAYLIFINNLETEFGGLANTNSAALEEELGEFLKSAPSIFKTLKEWKKDFYNFLDKKIYTS